MIRCSAKFRILLLVLLCILSGCQKIGNREYGVRFWKLPPWLGGGISERIFRPGETVIDYPILSSVYRFDAGVRDVSWGSDQQEAPVQTRARDGNEVALAVTVSYKVIGEAQRIQKLIRTVGTTNEDVQRIVMSAARADIRTYMNELRTSEFILDEPRYKAVDRVRESLRERLEPLGVEILRVNLDGFTFDEQYEAKLKEIQQQREETEREKARIATVTAKKEQELNNMQASVNQMIEAAKGYRNQATARGDNFLLSKENRAKAITAKGEAEVEALLEQIEALSGPGGRALLKLEIVKQLMKEKPKFVVLNEGESGQSLNVNRLDTNDLIGQVGLLEGLREQEKVSSNKKESAHEEKK